MSLEATCSATTSAGVPAAPVVATWQSARSAIKGRRIMVVDDEPINIRLMEKQLSADGYSQFIATTRADEVLRLVDERQPDVLILDVVMPGISGLTILSQLRDLEAYAHLPIIIVTASTDRQTRNAALDLGATDFLDKPLDPAQLLARVRNALILKSQFDRLRHWASDLEAAVKQRTAELEASRLELLHCLGRAAEFRDNETGRHVIRVGKYVGLIARQLGLDDSMVTLLTQTSQLHDMGKIGIPDAILLKPGRLTDSETSVMRQHVQLGSHVLNPDTHTDTYQRTPASDTQPHEHDSHDADPEYRNHTWVGKEIFGVGQSPMLRMAAVIAFSHHEKWDGTGYPLGLRGEQIPLPGRITAVADVFDALSSARPYKKAFPLEQCFQMVADERGKHFDPLVVDAFLACQDEVRRIYSEYSE